MTIQEYHYYTDIACKLFKYMNGRVNRINPNCDLRIEMYDFISNTFGNIKFPNHVTIHIGTIIDSWDEKWCIVTGMTRHDFICTCIAWAISHELHHADQLLSTIQYSRNEEYRNKIEGDVERASYEWVKRNSKQLSKIGGFRVVISSLDSDTLPDPADANYTRASIREFYLQTLANIVFRDFESYAKITALSDESKASDVQITFNKTDSVVIKSNWSYLAENINRFSDLVYKYAGFYDRYRITAETSVTKIEGDRDLVTVDILIRNPLFNPMVFEPGR